MTCRCVAARPGQSGAPAAWHREATWTPRCAVVGHSDCTAAHGAADHGVEPRAVAAGPSWEPAASLGAAASLHARATPAYPQHGTSEDEARDAADPSLRAAVAVGALTGYRIAFFVVSLARTLGGTTQGILAIFVQHLSQISRPGLPARRPADWRQPPRRCTPEPEMEPSGDFGWVSRRPGPLQTAGMKRAVCMQVVVHACTVAHA